METIEVTTEEKQLILNKRKEQESRKLEIIEFCKSFGFESETYYFIFKPYHDFKKLGIKFEGPNVIINGLMFQKKVYYDGDGSYCCYYGTKTINDESIKFELNINSFVNTYIVTMSVDDIVNNRDYLSKLICYGVNDKEYQINLYDMLMNKLLLK